MAMPRRTIRNREAPLGRHPWASNLRIQTERTTSCRRGSSRTSAPDAALACRHRPSAEMLRFNASMRSTTLAEGRALGARTGSPALLRGDQLTKKGRLIGVLEFLGMEVTRLRSHDVLCQVHRPLADLHVANVSEVLRRAAHPVGKPQQRSNDAVPARLEGDDGSRLVSTRATAISFISSMTWRMTENDSCAASPSGTM